VSQIYVALTRRRNYENDMVFVHEEHFEGKAFSANGIFTENVFMMGLVNKKNKLRVAATFTRKYLVTSIVMISSIR
jgi:hypothetical protein